MPLGDLLCVFFFLASLVLSCSQLVYRAVGMSENPEGQELIKGLLLLHCNNQVEQGECRDILL